MQNDLQLSYCDNRQCSATLTNSQYHLQSVHCTLCCCFASVYVARMHLILCVLLDWHYQVAYSKHPIQIVTHTHMPRIKLTFTFAISFFFFFAFFVFSLILSHVDKISEIELNGNFLTLQVIRSIGYCHRFAIVEPCLYLSLEYLLIDSHIF